MNIPRPGDDFDRLDEQGKRVYYQKVYDTLLIFKREIDLTFNSLDKITQDGYQKLERAKLQHKAEVDLMNKKMEQMSKKAEFHSLYVSANKVQIIVIKRAKDMEAELNAQVTFLERELTERNEKIKALTEKIADMNRNDFMTMEKMSSMRKEIELSVKKTIELEARLRKKIQQQGVNQTMSNKGAGVGPGDKLNDNKIEDQPKVEDSAGGKKPANFKVRPGSNNRTGGQQLNQSTIEPPPEKLEQTHLTKWDGGKKD